VGVVACAASVEYTNTCSTHATGTLSVTDTMLSDWMAASNELCRLSWHKLPEETEENLDRPQPGSNQIQYHLSETCSLQTQPNFIIMTANGMNECTMEQLTKKGKEKDNIIMCEIQYFQHTRKYHFVIEHSNSYTGNGQFQGYLRHTN
jgi:hypothetical protein